jgi:hypothetical protein
MREGKQGKTAPQRADQYITIPVAEYIYLQKLDALMDVLLGDGDYSTFRTLAAVRQSIREMKEHGKVAGLE